jgi:hypothetical protein
VVLLHAYVQNLTWFLPAFSVNAYVIEEMCTLNMLSAVMSPIHVNAFETKYQKIYMVNTCINAYNYLIYLLCPTGASITYQNFALHGYICLLATN